MQQPLWVQNLQYSDSKIIESTDFQDFYSAVSVNAVGINCKKCSLWLLNGLDLQYQKIKEMSSENWQVHRNGVNGHLKMVDLIYNQTHCTDQATTVSCMQCII